MQTANPNGEDFSQIRHLLQSNQLPVDDLDNLTIEFLVVRNGGHIAGCGALERLDGCCLLRSVAVDESNRRQGIAAGLTRALLAKAESGGYGGVYLLTIDAADYFARLGFESIERERAPGAIRSSSQFSELCPDSAVLMQYARD